MPHRKHRYAVIALAAAGIVGLGWVAYNANRAPGGPQAPAAAGAKAGGAGAPAAPLPVETALAAPQNITDEAAAVGTLRSNESVVLRPETAGRIASIGFKDGVPVAKGKVLVALDAATQEAELQQAKANHALAVTNFKRTEELLAKKFISQQSLDTTAANLKVQEAAVALAEAKLAKTRIRAPFAGVVGIREVSVGDYVKEGADLINLEDIRTLKLDFRLPELYLSRLQKGQAVEVSVDALPNQAFKAVLDAVDPLVDANGRAISLRARLDNPELKLRPGMFARVRLLFGNRDGVLMIPEQAIVSGGGKQTVFRIEEGKAKKVEVKTGLRRNAQVEILSGLAAGDRIITAGQLKVQDGSPVKAVDAAPQPAQDAEGTGISKPPATTAAPQAAPGPAAAPAKQG